MDAAVDLVTVVFPTGSLLTCWQCLSADCEILRDLEDASLRPCVVETGVRTARPGCVRTWAREKCTRHVVELL